MKLNLDGWRVIVEAASVGIGSAIARAFTDGGNAPPHRMGRAEDVAQAIFVATTNTSVKCAAAAVGRGGAFA